MGTTSRSQHDRRAFSKTRWRRFLDEAPLLSKALILLLTVELVGILLAPLVIPDHWYLRLYLSDRAESKTAEFATDSDPFLMWDDLVGWRNRPNSGRGKWTVDRFGARSTHAYDVARNGRKRILFLGNSLTNGGMHVSNDETISAFLEDSLTECLNFATMLYSVDQMYLSYIHYLRQFRPDAVVVGISGEPLMGLRNRYLPFWSQIEANVPLFKPRFELKADSLSLLSMPPRARFGTMLDDPSLLRSLEHSDRYYQRFSMYKRFGILPVSSAIWDATRKASSAIRLTRPLEDDDMKLFGIILSSLKSEASRDGIPMLVLVLPDRNSTFPAVWQSLLTDHYQHVVNFLDEEDFSVVDGRAALQMSQKPSGDLFTGDDFHFTPLGNRILAAAVRSNLGTSRVRDSSLVRAEH